jgi:DNA polymerase-3 subunit gamma/tau
MSAVLQRMAVIQAVPAAADHSDSETAEIARLAGLMPADETQLLYSLCLHGRAELGLAPDEYAGLTMVLLRLLAFKAPAVREPQKKTLNNGDTGLAPQRSPASPVVARPTPAPAAPLQAPAPARTAVPATGAPPGRVLRVVEAPPPQPAQRGASGDAPNGRPAGEVVGVPVRVQSESIREAASATTALVPTEEGDFWHATVTGLVAREAITALVRELALQSQLVGRDEGHWMLRVERESLNQPTSRERLQNALATTGHRVSLSVEVGAVTDSPARRMAAASAARQRAAEEIIHGDPFVQAMMREFGAKIVPGSIKPVTNDRGDRPSALSQTD